MILHALKEYYDRKAIDPDNGIAREGWENKEIPFVIVLDKEGDLVKIEDTREIDDKKKKGKSFLVPQGVKKTSGISSNLLWDSASYIFGIGEKGDLKKQSFIDRLKSDLGDLELGKVICSFLEKVSKTRLEQEESWVEICEKNPNLTFRLNTDSFAISNHPDIVSCINSEASKTNQEKRICIITGEKQNIKRLHTSIKGVYGAQSSGANIVSFNLDAFKSYGKDQGFNSPVGEEAEFAYTTALNTLLKSNSNRIQIGDASTVFWSEKETRFENVFSFLFKEPEKDNPDEGIQKVKSFFKSVKTGAYIKEEGSTRFYVLGLSPNAARISVRFWHVGTIAEFSSNIIEYFNDFKILKPDYEPEFYSLWRILVNVATQDKSENIPPNIAGDLMRSILTGTPFPVTLLQAAVRRIRSSSNEKFKPIRAALIKAYLNRFYRFYPDQNVKEINMELDIKQPSIGYQLGRLFASLEKIQEEANPGLNATIRERYFGAACATPVTVFTNLLRLKNHHLAKLENKGRVINFERLLGEIMGNLKDFPAHLDIFEQGRFAIGYYHQRQAFYASKEANNDVSNEINNREKF